jgi:TolB protein
MSGKDGWVDFQRTPAVGRGRAYIRPLKNENTTDLILAGAIAERSFVTTGPALIFSMGNGIKPGDIIDSGKQKYALNVTSTVDLKTVEIIVNGQVVQTLRGIEGEETTDYQGLMEVPKGGWVAARAYSANQHANSWPTLHARPFLIHRPFG